MYNGTNFCTNPFGRSKIIVIPNRCGHIIINVYIVLAIMKTDVNFEIRVNIEGRTAANIFLLHRFTMNSLTYKEHLRYPNEQF